MTEISGVVGALITPFSETGDIDLDDLETQAEYIVSHADALSILGAEVSEYSCLSWKERTSLLKRLTENYASRTTVLAGVSSPIIDRVKALAEIAEDAGAQYVQLLMPRLPSGASDDSALLTFLENAVAACNLPVVLYHHPVVGADPSFDTLVEATKLPGVVGIKDSSRNIARCLRAVQEIQREGHAQYLGTMQPMLAVLLSGGAGAMMPAPFTLIGAAMRDAVRQGDLERAGTAQQMFGIYPGKHATHGLLATARIGLEALGISAGNPYPPYQNVEPTARAAMLRSFRAWADHGFVSE